MFLVAIVLSFGAELAINQVIGVPHTRRAIVGLTMALCLCALSAVAQTMFPAPPGPGLGRTVFVSLLIGALLGGGVYLLVPRHPAGVQAVSALPSGHSSAGTAAPSASSSDVLFQDDLRPPRPGWAALSGGTIASTPDGLALKPDKGGHAVWVSAPTGAGAEGVRVVASARVVTSAGGWGVWCRGTTDGSMRYEFSVTNGSQEWIKDADGNVIAEGALSSFDILQPHQVAATCVDANGGVELGMTVDGGIPLTAMASVSGGPLIGPGAYGVHAFSYVDVVDDEPVVTVTSFEVDRAP